MAGAHPRAFHIADSMIDDVDALKVADAALLRTIPTVLESSAVQAVGVIMLFCFLVIGCDFLSHPLNSAGHEDGIDAFSGSFADCATADHDRLPNLRMRLLNRLGINRHLLESSRVRI